MELAVPHARTKHAFVRCVYKQLARHAFGQQSPISGRSRDWVWNVPVCDTIKPFICPTLHLGDVHERRQTTRHTACVRGQYRIVISGDDLVHEMVTRVLRFMIQVTNVWFLTDDNRSSLPLIRCWKISACEGTELPSMRVWASPSRSVGRSVGRLYCEYGRAPCCLWTERRQSAEINVLHRNLTQQVRAPSVHGMLQIAGRTPHRYLSDRFLPSFSPSFVRLCELGC